MSLACIYKTHTDTHTHTNADLSLSLPMLNAICRRHAGPASRGSSHDAQAAAEPLIALIHQVIEA